MISLLKSLVYLNVVTLLGLGLFLACLKRDNFKNLSPLLPILLLYCNSIVFLSPNIVLNLFASLITVPIFASKRSQILPVYVFSLLVMPAVSYSLGAGGTFLFVFTNFMSLSIGAYASIFIKGGSGKVSWTIPTTCMLAIFLVYFFADARAGSVTNVMRVFCQLILIFVLPYLVIRRSVRTPDDARNLLMAVVAACMVLSFVACYEAKKTWPIYRMIYDHYGIIIGNDVQVKMRGGIMRASGPFLESTSFAVWLSFGAFVGLTSRWMFKTRHHHWIVCGVLLAGLFAPQSRGAWLGLIVAFVFFQIGTGRVGAMIKGLFGAAIFGALTYSLALVIPQLGAMLGLNQSGEIGRDYRQDLLTRGLQEAQKNLFFGTDIDTVLQRLADLRQGEGIIDFVNTYLYVLLVSGLIGVVCFFLGMFIPVVVMWTKAAKFRQYGSHPMSVIAALLGSLMVMLVFTSLSGRTTMGLGMLLGAAAALSAMRIPQMGAGAKSAKRQVAGHGVQQLLAQARPKLAHFQD